MKQNRIFAFLLLLFCSSTGISQTPASPYADAKAPDYIKKLESWKATLEKAGKENKLVFIDLYFTGCFPCAQMDKDVFPNKIVSETLQKHFVSVSSDVFEEKIGDSIIKKYYVHGFPTFLILSPEGKLIDRFSGFKDPGILTERLNNALALHRQKKYLEGYSVNLQTGYPKIYEGVFNREDRKPLDSAAANQWIMANRGKHPEAAAVMFMALSKPDARLSEEFVNHYAEFSRRFGSEVSIEKIIKVLGKKLNEAGKTMTHDGFQQFLGEHESKIGDTDWPVVRHLLADTYYNSIKKDTTGYLTFMAKHPVIYQNYFGAYYNNMVVRKTLTPEREALMAAWGEKGIGDNGDFQIMFTTARLLKKSGKEKEGRAVIQKIIDKGEKYDMNVAYYKNLIKEF